MYPFLEINSKLKKYLVVTASCFTLLACQKIGYAPERIQSEAVVVNANTAPDSLISSFVAPYKASVDKEMNKTLAYAPVSLSKKDSKYNTAIGNMMADAVFEMANPIFEKRTGYPFDAVLLNYGGIRSGLNKGAVTTRTAYEIMPFENEIVVVELSGYQLKEMFDYLSRGTAHPIAGMQLQLHTDGSIKEARIQDQKIVDNQTYFIATSDYLQKGGDRMTFLTQPVSMLNLDYKIRNLLIDYFTKKDTIAPSSDYRFTKESL